MSNDLPVQEHSDSPGHQVTAEQLVSRVKREAASTALELGVRRHTVQKEIADLLGAPLGLLEVFIAFAREIQAEIRSAGADENRFESRDRVLVETRLHARACQIAAEISTLLREGFADGANARWRSLHEIATIAIFITMFEDSDRLAKRFMDYHEVEVYYLAEHQWKHRERGDVWKITEEDYVAAKRRFHDLRDEYGGSFTSPYGWATEVLKRSRVSFATIEEWVEMNHRRPDYEIANGNVHASSRGTLWRLGSQEMGDSLLQDGRSARGLERTIHATAISLNQATYGLYGAVVTWDWEPSWKAQRELANELGGMLVDIGHRKENPTTVEELGD